MNTMIENLINGNCKTARKLSKRFKLEKIVAFLRDNYGWTLEKAYACAVFLKTGEGFQHYCDQD